MASKGKSKRRTLLVVIGILGLASCAAPPTAQTEASPSPAPTLTLFATASSTPIPELTGTPYVTPFSSSSPVFPASPNVYVSLADRLLFADEQGCRLPCWYGLRPGISGADEIQPALRKALYLPEDYTFHKDESGNDFFYIEGHWSPPPYPSAVGEHPAVLVEGFYKPQTRILTSLHFQWSNFTKDPTTPQRILREFGLPDYVLLRLSDIFHGYTSPATIFVYVQKGLVIELDFILPVQTSASGGSFAEWCLNGGKGYDEYYVDVLIVSPTNLEATGEALSAASEWHTLEEVFGLTVEKVHQRAVQEDNACLYLEF